MQKPVRKSAKLAEIMGIVMGDGSLYIDKKGKYHVNIAFNKKEVDYLVYVKNLVELCFGYKFCVVDAKNEYFLRNVSKRVGSLIYKYGMPPGNKVKNNVNIPVWIFKRENYKKRFIRGLFDTDGCIYRKYGSFAQIQFKLATPLLLESSKQLLEDLEFHPTKIQMCTNKNKSIAWKYYLCRQLEILKFMNGIAPKNPKNNQRYLRIKNGVAGTFRP